MFIFEDSVSVHVQVTTKKKNPMPANIQNYEITLAVFVICLKIDGKQSIRVMFFVFFIYMWGQNFLVKVVTL